MRVCPACRREVTEDQAAFCPFCASALQTVRICPACRREVTEDQAVFCPFCASALQTVPGPPTVKSRTGSLASFVGLAVIGAVAAALIVLFLFTRGGGSETAVLPGGNSNQNVAVPNLSQRTLAEAAAALADVNLALGAQTEQTSDTVESGLVVSQDPPAGASVGPGSTVDVVVSSGTPAVVVNPPSALKLTAVTSSPTSSSVTLRWKRPPNGERPDRYFIYRAETGRDFRLIKKTTKLTATDAGVTWGTSYGYKVRSVFEGKLSPPTGPETKTTPNPSADYARLEGSVSTQVNLTGTSGNVTQGGWAHEATWTFTPQCASGSCSVGWSATHVWSNGRAAARTSGTLTKSGTAYQGTYVGYFGVYCSGSKITSSVSITVAVTGTGRVGAEFRATGFSGTIHESFSGQFSCGSGSIDFTFSGTLP